MNIFVVASGLLSIAIPAAPFWNGSEHFNYVFGLTPRTTTGSLLAFLVGSMLNAYVMSRMKEVNNSRHFSFRAIISTIVGEGADSLIFFPIAFGGMVPWKEVMMMAVTQIVLRNCLNFSPKNHEDCVNIIMKDLIHLMDTKYIEVTGIFTPRGGISIYPLK